MGNEAKSRTNLTKDELALLEAGRAYAESQRERDAQTAKLGNILDSAALPLEWVLANEARSLASKNLHKVSMALLRVTK